MSTNLKTCRDGEGEEELKVEDVSSRTAQGPGLHASLDPMMNPVILTRLFQVCELSDVFKYRLVCKEWHSLSLARFRKDASVTIGQQLLRHELKDFAKPGAGDLQWSHLADELQLEKPFQSFHLSAFEFMSTPYRSTPPWHSRHHRSLHLQPSTFNFLPMYQNMEQFWRKYGVNIRKLKLSDCDIFSLAAFNKVIFEELPNLEELNLNKVREALQDKEAGDDERNEELITVQSNLKTLVVNKLPSLMTTWPWRSMFLHFPNIKKLELAPSEYKRVAEALEGLNNGNMEMKELRLEYGSSEEEDYEVVIEKLLNLPHFALETLVLDFKKCQIPGVAHHVFNTAMERHGTTLKKLSMLMDHIDPRLVVEEPINQFPFRSDPSLNLEVLVIEGPVSPNLHFLQQLPQLKTLYLAGFQFQMLQGTDWEMMRRNVRLPRLEYLQLGCYVTAEVIDLFATMMPNVEILKAELDTFGFRVVCGRWRNLRTLQLASCINLVTEDLLRNTVGDEGLTGIVAGWEGRLPNIVDLKHLQELFILTRGRIGDASIWNGFLKLPNLRVLSVVLAEETSEEALDVLVARFPKSSGSLIHRKIK